MIEEWLGTSPSELWLVPVSALGVMAAAIVAIRLVGLRSLSKMSGFDFVVTVALGSIVGSVAASATSLTNGALALTTLLILKGTIAAMRRRTNIGSALDNEPLLLVDGGGLIEDHLDRAQVSRHDVIAKLREANVTRWDQVLAVVFETTGDISVLHGDGPLDESLLEGVRRPASSAQ